MSIMVLQNVSLYCNYRMQALFSSRQDVVTFKTYDKNGYRRRLEVGPTQGNPW